MSKAQLIYNAIEHGARVTAYELARASESAMALREAADWQRIEHADPRPSERETEAER